jgi:hypothetical protein
MTRIPGPGAKRTIKDVVDGMNAISKVIRGEKVAVKKKRAAPVRKSTKNIMEEKELEASIIWRLRQAGYWVYKTSSTSGAYDYNTQNNPSGVADLMVIGKPGGIVFIEVKVPTKRHVKNGGLTGKQPEFRDICQKAGVKYVVAYSVTDALDAVRG